MAPAPVETFFVRHHASFSVETVTEQMMSMFCSCLVRQHKRLLHDLEWCSEQRSSLVGKGHSKQLACLSPKECST
jgi:hypothetical protein